MAKRVIAVIHSNVGSTLSRQALKVLSRQVNAATALPESRCPLKWVNTPLTFGPGDLPQNMAGAGELPAHGLPNNRNACIKHVLVDGGVGLNVLSVWAFTELGIPAGKLTPAPPFGRVGPGAADVHRLDRLEQGLSKRSLSPP